MKRFKFLLAVSVISAFIYFIFSWYIGNIDGPKILPPKNTYTEEIQKKIDAINSLPSTQFSRQEYEKIRSSIYLFSKEGYLGIKSVKEGKIWKNIRDDSNNKLWNEILSKNLYAAYTKKFIDQANHVLNSTLWRVEDLSFIRNEIQYLKKSPFLAPDDTDAQKLESISTVLNEYNQINNFISTCNNYKYTNFGIDESFPDLSNLMNTAKSFLDKGFKNEQLNNCIRIKNSLKSLPNTFFNKQYDYYKEKIDKQAERYVEYPPIQENQPKYRTEIYDKLRNQINEKFDGELYGIDQDSFEQNQQKLNLQLKKYGQWSNVYFQL